MRAQVSLEYLLVSVISLALLSLSVAALLEIKEYSDSASESLRFRYSANALANAMEDVCALGPGNSREVLLSAEVSVDREEGGVRLSGHGSMVRPLRCEIPPESGLEGALIVENEEGKIKIRGR